MTRTGESSRTTRETSVKVTLDLDGRGTVDVATGVPFLDHMLDQLGRHGRLDLTVHAQGDTEIDAHHTVEDTGLAIGEALGAALGERAGIERFGDATVPIDEALARVALDCSGRPYLVADLDWPLAVVGSYESHLTTHFLESLVAQARLSVHATLERAENGHHAHEAVFKALAVALRRAVAVTGEGVPSTKGSLG
ncbi:imidazoleglycerol-phosphate dehydratase HisB [Egibacter rhizosphaerae]|uniref:Imidazoleglycerol-phosphate dehydratase n=1 Tax=Egibacter rhizosphaerae TaxID=1670831 RepID=A0A411YKR5_9ACTN|nr:imidazoleglycerol-phosphate dehydratase HisB [Egibacter rhizosphaerae]QBI21809.1 imidazoleglycerol-phosphate dehydratase HisB [Egibacter rhizosphaerae]